MGFNDTLIITNQFDHFMETVPVTTLVSGKSCGVNFDKSCLIYLPYVSMTTITNWGKLLGI